jgi:hypothetical protein
MGVDFPPFFQILQRERPVLRRFLIKDQIKFRQPFFDHQNRLPRPDSQFAMSNCASSAYFSDGHKTVKSGNVYTRPVKGISVSSINENHHNLLV